MQLSIIIGVTASGKTALATEYARETDAPVVVLDRFQCFPELAVVSGRPAESSWYPTTRLYLDDRRLADGELSSGSAYAALLSLLSELAGRERMVILEGGSLSLGRKLMSTLDLLPYESTIHIRDVDIGAPVYRTAVVERIKVMLGRDQAEPNLLDELGTAWQLEEQRGFLQTICGYDALLSWCQQNRIPPEEVSLQRDRSALMDDLVDLVAASHFQYARAQLQAFESWKRSIPCVRDRLRYDAPPDMQPVPRYHWKADR